MLIFRTVARTGSIAGAARELGWTQPAVGHHLRLLEREARCPLVVRRSRGVQLTEAGRALLEHADAVAARLHAAEEELAAHAQLRAGTVRIAAFPSATAVLVPRALAALALRMPGVEVRIVEAEPPEAVAMTRDGRADLALVFHYPESAPALPAGSVERPIGTEEVRLVLPAGHRLAGAPIVPLAELRAERWVAGCARCSEHLHRVCARAGFTPDKRHSTDNYVVVQALVASGLAVSLLPALALESHRDPGVAVARTDLAGHRALGVVHHEEAVRSPGVAAAVDELVGTVHRVRSVSPP